MTVEKKFSALSKLQGILAIVGALCFLCVVAFSIVHLGFMNRTIHLNKPSFQFLSRNELWLLNLGLGLVGGSLLDLKRIGISSLAGIACAASITAFSILYLSWRESFINVEVIIILGIGILPGIFMYRLLHSLFYKKREQQ